MKKLVFFIFSLFVCSCVHGQINYSVEAGPMISFGKIDKESSVRSLTTYSYHVGGSLNYKLKKVILNMGLQLNQTQWNRQIGSSDDFKTRVVYFSLNPNIEFKLSNDFGFNLGFYGAYNIEERSFDNISNEWVKTPPQFNIELHAPFDYGISLGGKFYLLQNFSIGVKYNLGLNNISGVFFIDSNGNNFTGNSLKNRNIQVSLIYSFLDDANL